MDAKDRSKIGFLWRNVEYYLQSEWLLWDLWLWLYTMWSCMIGWLERYGSSCWDWNEEQCVGELLKGHICTMERITGMKLMSCSIMTIIVSSSIFEPSQHSVAVTVYHVVMCDWVTRLVRFITLRLKWKVVRWWSCSIDIFVQLNVLLIWNWCLVRTWRSFRVRVFLSQVNTLWLWLYTMWTYTFKRSIYYGINLNLFRT